MNQTIYKANRRQACKCVFISSRLALISFIFPSLKTPLLWIIFFLDALLISLTAEVNNQCCCPGAFLVLKETTLAAHQEWDIEKIFQPCSALCVAR